MKNWKKYTLYLVIGVIVLVCVARWRVLFVGDGHIFTVHEIDQVGECQDVIVLGAGVRDDGSMTPILEERADTVRDLYVKGKACKIIASGLEEEVVAVKKYLIGENVPEKIIQLDSDGVDTFASIKNAQEMFDIDRVLIVTQDFHLSRAVYIARMRGIDANGYEAYKYYPYIMLEEYKYIFRDVIASVKAVVQVEIIKS